jgi:hypothetical protein
MLADQRRLVAPGKAVDDAGVLGLARQQRARDRVCLHIDHDDMLAVRDCAQGMADAGGRNAGGFDDHLEVREGDQRFGVGCDVDAPGLESIAERGGRHSRLGPSGAAKLA